MLDRIRHLVTVPQKRFRVLGHSPIYHEISCNCNSGFCACYLTCETVYNVGEVLSSFITENSEVNRGSVNI